VRHQISHPYKTTCKIIFLYVLMFLRFLERRQKTLNSMLVRIPGMQSAHNFFVNTV